ncbi:DUF6709 family protein [Anaerosporobacter faecicola]|uniref:DUF6709 family protein n=1 Tax=Anaerosporobacter faecicola TaxID=2718714 RepID=UPI00143B48E2|nr:DUF6709 family protein [Anaerosporobacter faecicola]
MLQKVRKSIMKKAIIKVIVCIAVIVGALLFTDMAAIKLVKGPETVNINSIDLDQFKGKYVETKIGYIYDYYLEEETYTKYKDGSRSAGTITARYYLTAVNEQQYITVLADGKKLMDKFMTVLDKTTAALDNGTELDEITYKGTFTKLTNREYSELKSYMTSYGITEDMYSDYVFKVNYIGNCEETNMELSIIVMAVALLFLIVTIIRAFSGRYVKAMKKFAAQNGITFDQLCMELEAATEINDVWVNARYTAYVKGNKIRVLKNENYIWAYYKETKQKRKGVTYYTRQVALVDRNKKTTLVLVKTEDDARRILESYSATQEQMVLGYNDDLNNLFRNNFDQFVLLPYQNRETNEESASAYEYEQQENQDNQQNQGFGYQNDGFSDMNGTQEFPTQENNTEE